MNKENFYMHLCYYLLNKFSNNAIAIPTEEWDKMFGGQRFLIKHRVHDGNLEVIALENNEQ